MKNLKKERLQIIYSRMVLHIKKEITNSFLRKRRKERRSESMNKINRTKRVKIKMRKEKRMSISIRMPIRYSSIGKTTCMMNYYSKRSIKRQ